MSNRGRLKETFTVRKATRPDNPVLPLRQLVGDSSNCLIAYQSDSLLACSPDNSRNYGKRNPGITRPSSLFLFKPAIFLYDTSCQYRDCYGASIDIDVTSNIYHNQPICRYFNALTARLLTSIRHASSCCKHKLTHTYV